MGCVTDKVKQLLREERMEHLEVFEGNCTERTMIWVRRTPVALGSPVPLTENELNMLDVIFQQSKPHEGAVYSYGAWKAKAAMALGVWRKKLPVCGLCGRVFKTEGGAAQCVEQHMESGQR